MGMQYETARQLAVRGEWCYRTGDSVKDRFFRRSEADKWTLVFYLEVDGVLMEVPLHHPLYGLHQADVDAEDWEKLGGK
jgi:hypothetical protein